VTADSPQRIAIAELTTLLQADEAARGLVLIGSCAHSGEPPDVWSDVDLVLVVEDDALPKFFPPTGWLTRFREPYACSLSQNEFFCTARVFFADHHQVDLVVVPESALQRVDEWDSNPFGHGARCLFSRSSVLDRFLVGPAAHLRPRDLSTRQPNTMVEEFWFKGMLAAKQVARGDLLVAVHLALDMMRDCCVLGMMLRDRHKRTDHHSHGSPGDRRVTRLLETHRGLSSEGILEIVVQSAIAFDSLASELLPKYQERRGPLISRVEHVRESLRDCRSA